MDTEQRGDERAIVAGVPVRLADPLLTNHTFSVHHERGGIPRDLIVLLDLERRVVHHVEREAELLGERRDLVVANVVDAHSDHLEPRWTVIPVQRLDARHLDAAGAAPRRPHVDEQHLPLVRVERDLLCAVQAVRVELGGGGTHFHREDVVAVKVHGGPGSEAEQRHHDENDRPLPARAHTDTTQSSRRAPISARGFAAEKIALPATNVSAPARQTSAIVSRLMPPSASITASLWHSSSNSRARRTLSTTYGMNSWPPNPGFTVMMSRRPRSGTT